MNNQYLDKLEFDSVMEEFLNKIYNSINLKPTDEIYEVVTKLDEYIFLTARDTYKAIETFCGFTDSFGIISAFPESKLSADYTIGLSEREAKKVLRKYRKVAIKEKIHTLNSKDVERLLRGGCLSLKLLREGFDGIVVPDFDEELGFIGDL